MSVRLTDATRAHDDFLSACTDWMLENGPAPPCWTVTLENFRILFNATPCAARLKPDKPQDGKIAFAIAGIGDVVWIEEGPHLP